MDQALDKAILVFSERGYHASSINDLTQAMELAAGSVYKAFKDKRAIFIAAFDRYKLVRNAQLAQAISSAVTGRAQLEAALMFYAESAQGAQGILGCLVVNGATELATFDEEIAQKVRVSLANSEKMLSGLIAAGKQDGSIMATADEQVLGRALLSVTQGMRVIGKTGRSREDMQAVVSAALKMLE
ncbi:TetR/AcrR family transcriptional regulator [Serratia sp. M24T3]|uniref:TetR/AcrR family transcriptional regulator n=1 Tax=Serratia sp. M24T3 TaxID=932213 RepID=UPI00025BA28E|nr:TetR/AcrR family transcriptional regulator [Serratia sp. M24T3]EIC86106.1 TetR family transcriptional regulator [Serratia sp. M24T3]